MLSRALTKQPLLARSGDIRIISCGIGNELQSQSTSLPFEQQRRTFVLKALYRFAKRQMPKISKTEQIALGCGTIGTFRFDNHIFEMKDDISFLFCLFQTLIHIIIVSFSFFFTIPSIPQNYNFVKWK